MLKDIKHAKGSQSIVIINMNIFRIGFSKTNIQEWNFFVNTQHNPGKISQFFSYV